MIIPLLSILILTIFVWIINKKSSIQICPVCAGVFFTWFSLFLGMFFGKLSVVNYQLPIAILAGGTVVGLMSKLEEFIEIKFVLIWKTIFVISGFGAIYSLVNNQWILLIINVITNIAITFLFKINKLELVEEKSRRIKALEDKMKNCC